MTTINNMDASPRREDDISGSRQTEEDASTAQEQEQEPGARARRCRRARRRSFLPYYQVSCH